MVVEFPPSHVLSVGIEEVTHPVEANPPMITPMTPAADDTTEVLSTVVSVPES